MPLAAPLDKPVTAERFTTPVRWCCWEPVLMGMAPTRRGRRAQQQLPIRTEAQCSAPDRLPSATASSTATLPPRAEACTGEQARAAVMAGRFITRAEDC